MQASKTSRISRSALILIIDIYRNILSPLMLPACRHWPTCSAYAREAIARHGAMRGVARSLQRLLRCHPFMKPTMDPIN